MIYTGKPEILVGKSNGSRHPVCRLDFRGRDSAYERGWDARRKFWIIKPLKESALGVAQPFFDP